MATLHVRQSTDELIQAYREALRRADELADPVEKGFVAQQIVESAERAADHVHSRHGDSEAEDRLRDYAKSLKAENWFGELVGAAKKRAIGWVVSALVGGPLALPAVLTQLGQLAQFVSDIFSGILGAGREFGEALVVAIVAGAIPVGLVAIGVRAVAAVAPAVPGTAEDYMKALSDAWRAPAGAKAIVEETVVPSERLFFDDAGTPSHWFLHVIGPTAAFVILLPIALLGILLLGVAIGIVSVLAEIGGWNIL